MSKQIAPDVQGEQAALRADINAIFTQMSSQSSSMRDVTQEVRSIKRDVTQEMRSIKRDNIIWHLIHSATLFAVILFFCKCRS